MKSRVLFYVLQLLEKQHRYLINQEVKQHNDYNSAELALCRLAVSDVSLEYSKKIQEEFGLDKDNG